ncbi:uncharacterized protein LOC113356649 [Papaver somniferum]|uniref:uncharacterized protein LOC113356649 n=1 Tax=Papaver somniferum TaxID=3469 RepID=UPI000E6F532A|nr:uncharacterized protein LOC113356649 [Papaver somniferum]
MKRLKVAMNDWSLRVFGNINSRLKQDQLRFEVAAMASDEDPSDSAKLNSVKYAMAILSQTRLQQNNMLKQKARNQWLLQSSNNTNFFHNNIRIRRSSNTISELVDANGDTISDYDLLHDHVVQYYEDKFNGHEIYGPGPDGFSGCFCRHCWDIIHEDLENAIIYSWNTGHIPNATRLSSVLDKLVSEEHVAFMKGRNIHENISLASEMDNELHIKRKDGNLGLKLAISQAFDTINRGLRQGDPLSPLIFVLIEDVLSRNITKKFRDKKMTPMVTRNGFSPTHVVFADDIMIFCKGNLKSVHNLVELLGKYQAASGQTVCRQKSKIYYGGGSLSRRTLLVDFLGMNVTTFLDRYLGIQIMPGTVRYHHISNVIEKIKAQLAVYKWPKKFIVQCERAIRNFIWSGDSNISRAVVVAYDKVYCLFEEGGLGLTRMATMNKALLMILWWKIRNSKKKWAGFLRTKYFTRNECIKTSGVKSSILPGIRWVYKIVESNSKVIIGDGRTTSLYFDNWCIDVCIADILNDHNLDRNAMVSDNWYGVHWTFTAEQMELFATDGVNVADMPLQ